MTLFGNLLSCDLRDGSICLSSEKVSREAIVDECIVAFEREPFPHGINEQRERLELIERSVDGVNVASRRRAAQRDRTESVGVLGLPTVCSFGITPSSFPRSGVSNKLRALQLVGPAGAGKTTAMNALRRAWEKEWRSGNSRSVSLASITAMPESLVALLKSTIFA